MLIIRPAQLTDLTALCAIRYAEQPRSVVHPISDFTVRRIMDAVAGAQHPLPQSIEPRQWLE
jgi:hypothetical protein